MYHDTDFSILQHILPEKPFVVDVGANRGQSIQSIKFARPKSIIHSFEPNPEFKEPLESLKNIYDDINIYNIGLGNSHGEMQFFLPVINGVRYVEETTMRLAALEEPWVVERFKERGERVEFEVFRAQVSVGDDFNFRPDLIKIDVEGVESEVVAGFSETIISYAPILLVENGDWTRLHPIIKNLGYKAMMPNENFTKLVPFSGTRINTFYIKA